MQSNSQYSHLEIIRTGSCVGILPKYCVQTDNIIAFPISDLPIKKELWLLARADIAKLKAVRITIKYLKKIFAENCFDF